MTKLRLKAVILVIILLATSTYLMVIHNENINAESVMKLINVSELYNASANRRPYNANSTGRPHNTSTIRRPYNANSTGRSYNTSTTRRPYNASTTGRPYYASTTGRGTEDRRFPRALILGFDKAGTDTLRDMLLMNPKIVAPRKEINFFTFSNLAKGVEWYRNQMPMSYEDQITIEKSIYIRDRNTPYTIRDFYPNMKLMIIVREPVVRLISDYLDQKRKNPKGIPSTFEKWVCYGCKKYANVERSIYSIHYQQYLKFFPSDQIFIVDGDKLIDEPYPVIKETEKFLGVDIAITRDHFYFNETKGFWCMKSDIENARGCQGPLKGREHPHVNPNLIIELRKYYHPYNLKFYSVTGINFGWPEY